jgi:DNA-binding beta-propeller fold protein YncE
VQVFDSVAVGYPSGIAVAEDGTVWMVDLYDGGVRTLAPDGTVQRVPISKSDGPLAYPTGIALDDGTAWIVDSGHHAIRRLDPDGTLSRVAGGRVDAPFADGNGDQAGLEPLLGLVQLDDTWIVADAGNYRLRALTAGDSAATTAVTSFAGHSARFELVDGTGKDAELALPTGLAVDAARGVVYVADTGNAVIRAITP